VRRPPVLNGIALGIAIFELAGRWWLQYHGPSGHAGALVLGTGFVTVSPILIVCGILCGIGALLRRERYRWFSVVVIIVLLAEWRTLQEYL
jgi:hypothetical protein